MSSTEEQELNTISEAPTMELEPGRHQVFYPMSDGIIVELLSRCQDHSPWSSTINSALNDRLGYEEKIEDKQTWIVRTRSQSLGVFSTKDHAEAYATFLRHYKPLEQTVNRIHDRMDDEGAVGHRQEILGIDPWSALSEIRDGIQQGPRNSQQLLETLRENQEAWTRNHAVLLSHPVFAALRGDHLGAVANVLLYYLAYVNKTLEILYVLTDAYNRDTAELRAQLRQQIEDVRERSIVTVKGEALDAVNLRPVRRRKLLR